MRISPVAWVLAACLCSWATLAAAADGLIELTVDGKSIQGRKLAHNSQQCWLAERDGRLQELKLARVTEFRQVAPEFSALTVMEQRDQLRTKFGKGVEVVVDGQYVVCAPPGRARPYAALLQQANQEFEAYFRVRKFELTPLEFPLVAFVFPTKEQFLTHCQRAGMGASQTLRGYYDTRTNWVYFYDEPASPLTPVAAMNGKRSSSGPGINPAARDTTVHEAVHQLAFNRGLHSRIGKSPTWVIEGLAMQFEIGSAVAPSGRRGAAPVNPARLKSFAEYRRDGRRPGALAELISGESLFSIQPVEAYSEAWMLTHYLIRTRPAKYAAYLKSCAARDPFSSYLAEERIADFRGAFGDDLAWFDVEYLRFADSVIAETLP
ncbi:MAG: DUF1570 domain-containing protein [Planctomyces sp.]|nr:DUF1570 domain-containing protein [Planctomyces sp.]